MSGLVLEGFSVARGGFPIVREVDLVVPEGEVTVLLGPNGAGKTTLLEAISGVIPGDGGLSLDGQALKRASRVKLVHTMPSASKRGRRSRNQPSGAGAIGGRRRQPGRRPASRQARPADTESSTRV